MFKVDPYDLEALRIDLANQNTTFPDGEDVLDEAVNRASVITSMINLMNEDDENNGACAALILGPVVYRLVINIMRENYLVHSGRN